MATEDDCRRVEMCINEGGMVKGRDYIEVTLTGADEVSVWSWRVNDPDKQRLVHKAFTLCGLTTQTFEEWAATPVSPKDYPHVDATTINRLR